MKNKEEIKQSRKHCGSTTRITIVKKEIERRQRDVMMLPVAVAVGRRSSLPNGTEVETEAALGLRATGFGTFGRLTQLFRPASFCEAPS